MFIFIPIKKINNMKKIKMFVCATVGALMLSSCAMVKSPVSGFLYTSVKAPVAATSNAGSTKVGTSKATSILGWFATGDASIDAAAKSAGITKIHHVDEKCMSVLGLFAKYEVFVYGE
jgi:ABC-type sugar transport system substrate-binding protein